MTDWNTDQCRNIGTLVNKNVQSVLPVFRHWLWVKKTDKVQTGTLVTLVFRALFKNCKEHQEQRQDQKILLRTHSQEVTQIQQQETTSPSSINPYQIKL